jgi:hypothetical protein
VNVAPYDPPFRWLVESETRDEIVHLVEFADDGKSAECSCEDFHFRIRPMGIVEGCKHIKAARAHFHNFALQHYAKAQGEL